MVFDRQTYTHTQTEKRVKRILDVGNGVEVVVLPVGLTELQSQGDGSRSLFRTSRGCVVGMWILFRAKYREMSSSGMLEGGSQVGS